MKILLSKIKSGLRAQLGFFLVSEGDFSREDIA